MISILEIHVLHHKEEFKCVGNKKAKEIVKNTSFVCKEGAPKSNHGMGKSSHWLREWEKGLDKKIMPLFGHRATTRTTHLRF